MKGLIIQRVVVSSILFFFISCTISKINSSEEKVELSKNYYTINYHKSKSDISPKFSIKVFMDEEKDIANYFFICVNGVWANVKDTIFNCEVRSDRKYDIDISAMGFRGMSIRNIKVSEKDSVVINAYLNEGEVLY